MQLEDGETAFFANGRAPRDPIAMNAADFRSPGLAPDAALAAAEYPDPGFFSRKLAHADPELAAAISSELVRQQDQREEIGAFNHSWHIGNRHFAQDLFETLIGDADRNVVSTRRLDVEGRLHLVVAGGE